jgi:hypothetical protein
MQSIASRGKAVVGTRSAALKATIGTGLSFAADWLLGLDVAPG